MLKPDETVSIIGAGLSGLSCAYYLSQRGVPFSLFEGSSRVGGRVATDRENGFTFDRGFQVFLPAYEEAKRILNYDRLKLRSFFNGAQIVLPQGRALIGNPLKHPTAAISSLTAQFAPLSQKVRIGLFQLQATLFGPLAPREETTYRELQSRGLDGRAQENFFHPFFSGVFLETQLKTSAETFWQLFRYFAKEGAALPEEGMQAIPEQIAACFRDRIRLGMRLSRITENQLVFENGQAVDRGPVILCLSFPELLALLKRSEIIPSVVPAAPTVSTGTSCFYFSSERVKHLMPALILNATRRGKINSIAPLSRVSPSYSMNQRDLLSVNVVGTEFGIHPEQIQQEAAALLGLAPEDLTYLRTYEIADPLPDRILQAPLLNQDQRIDVAGDFLEQGSINGALRSGRLAAERIVSSS